MNDRPAQSVLFAIIGTAHALEARMEEALADFDLSLAKFGILDVLARAGDSVPLSELAARSSCVKSNITQLVDRLEADELVRRTPDPADRRVTLAELTAKGNDRREAASAALAKVQESCLATLPAGDQASLNWALKRLA